MRGKTDESLMGLEKERESLSVGYATDEGVARADPLSIESGERSEGGEGVHFVSNHRARVSLPALQHSMYEAASRLTVRKVAKKREEERGVMNFRRDF